MVMGYAMDAARKNKKIFFVDKSKNINFQKIIDINNLKRKMFSRILNPEIRRFKSIESLISFSKKTENRELIFSINIVNKYDSDLEKDIKRINRLTVSKIEDSDVIITTAHKAKGLEFEQVVLSNDYYIFFDSKGFLKQNIKKEEINILYVALTRAKSKLKLNKTLNDLMGMKQ